MSRSQLVSQNKGIFESIKQWADNRQLGGRDRSGALKMVAATSPGIMFGAAIGAGVAAPIVVPVVVAVAAIAAGGYAAYKLHLDKAIVSASIRMTEKVKGLFSGPSKDITNKAEAQKAFNKPKNETFEKIDKIIESHNRGDKFDTQTGQPLGSNPMETMKAQGISDDQIKQWQQRNQPTENKPTIESMAAMGRESGKSLSDSMFSKPSSQTLKQ